ncbi:MAG TPA: M50 family metallopeptidase [Polyangiaceae bacterium]|nr:M50 family metallopeptidase [Polyangiaceae bacterium]
MAKHEPWGPMAVHGSGRYTFFRRTVIGFYIVAILGLALLMVVHETGHLAAARAFGMRVLRFSIGFGPPLWRYQSKKSGTVYQVAPIPFVAYVQIDGMNPFEEADPDDKGSYANASLLGRIVTIFAGPLANYLFASVLFFVAFFVGGETVPTTTVELLDGPAKAAQMQNGDTIVAIDGVAVTDWEQMRSLILARSGKALNVEVTRGAERKTFSVVPVVREGRAMIGVAPVYKHVSLGARESLIRSVESPAMVVAQLVTGVGRMLAGKEKPQLTGPVGIVKEAKRAAERSFTEYFRLLAILSAYLGGFNLLPIPALDGARLGFLGYEAVTRRKPNAKVEAQVHFVGLLMLLALIFVVSSKELFSHEEGPGGAAPARPANSATSPAAPKPKP